MEYLVVVLTILGRNLEEEYPSGLSTSGLILALPLTLLVSIIYPPSNITSPALQLATENKLVDETFPSMKYTFVIFS